MDTHDRPLRRLPWRGRVLMALFVVPALLYSAATRDEDAEPDQPATTLPEVVLPVHVARDDHDHTLAEPNGQIANGSNPPLRVPHSRPTGYDTGSR